MDERLRQLERRAAQGDAGARGALERARARMIAQPGVFPGPIHGLVLVLGGRGSGKTTWLQALESRATRNGGDTVVWDRLGHWLDAPNRTVLRVSNPELVAAEAIRRAPCTLFLDEIHLAWPISTPPREGTALNEIVRVGRQACAVGPFARPGPVAIVGAAQRPMNVHPDLKGLVDRLYLGRFSPTATRDLKWIGDVAGEDVARRLITLGVGQFLPIDCN